MHFSKKLPTHYSLRTRGGRSYEFFRTRPTHSVETHAYGRGATSRPAAATSSYDPDMRPQPWPVVRRLGASREKQQNITRSAPQPLCRPTTRNNDAPLSVLCARVLSTEKTRKRPRNRLIRMIIIATHRDRRASTAVIGVNCRRFVVLFGGC